MDYTTLYCLVLFAVGSLAGMSRCVKNGDYQSLAHCVAVGSVAGFFAFACVRLALHDIPGDAAEYSTHTAIAAAIGVTGREGTYLLDQLMKVVTKRLFGKID